ncbi:MAG: polyprenol monophosphomannose synthase [Chloroflexi bacterium]|nr:polyprenol monophosphomannose synthase [Chloroflexota bacterium]
MQRVNVSVVLPTYNEAENIGPLTLAILAHLTDPVEVWVVDDDSPDGTWGVVANLAAQDPRVRLLRRTDARGLTSAISAGIAASSGDVVVWMDCDFSMPPEVIPQLVYALRTGADVALGSRYVPGGGDVGHSWMARAFSWTINAFAALLLGWGVRDYTSGFVAARREVLERIPLQGDYGEYCIDLLHRAQRLGYQVEEIPYTCVTRASGESKTGANALDYLRRGWKYVRTILQLRLSR